MAKFLGNYFSQQSASSSNRRLLNSTPPYTGGIFPVDPSSAANALLVGASALGALGSAADAGLAVEGANTAGALNAALGSIKGIARIAALSMADQVTVKPTPILFQFFPESITDSRENNVEATTLPGYSLPIPTFSGSSGRSISMVLTFSQERWQGVGSRLAPNHWDKYNFDVGLAVQAIRKLAYPIGLSPNSLVDIGITPIPFALSLPNTRIGIDKDFIYCYLRSYSVDYMAFFPDGQPRLAKISLSMEELLVDLSENVTGNSFDVQSSAYSNGARNAIDRSLRQFDAGSVRTVSVSINRFENIPK